MNPSAIGITSFVLTKLEVLVSLQFLAVSEFMSYLKGKSALMFFDRHPEVHVSWADRHLWARGYYVETVGNVNEETVRAYIRNQEENDKLEDSTKK